MIVYQLTEQQKNELVGQLFAPASMFNPVQDANGIWIITDQEVNGCVNPNFLWVQNLPTITYVPPVIPENRQQKIDMVLTYLKSEITDSEYKNFIQDARNYLIDYTYYSDAFYYWVETSNNPNWGDFTQNGFKTKSYCGDLVDGVYPRAEYILNILNPMI